MDGAGGMEGGAAATGRVGHPHALGAGCGTPPHVNTFRPQPTEAAGGDGAGAEGKVIYVCVAAGAVAGLVAEGKVASAAAVGGHVALDTCPASVAVDGVEHCERIGVVGIGHDADFEAGIAVFVIVVEVYIQLADVV